MSIFVQHECSICDFFTSDSWVILSPIEQSIKNKIESIGTPLKEWNIKINYGIKTGCNEAFIISTEKRNEILENCKTKEERDKTEELIRPILRGRDIKKYNYIWADLWLIATFPSRHYDINDYNSVKSYLLTFGIKRLEQTGKEYVINGNKIKSRKKTKNKWYEIQDSISYWEDFSKPKIVWGNLNLQASYALVEDNCFINAPSPMIVPASKYLLAVLNSKLADYYIRKLGVTRNGGYFEYKPMFVEQLPVPLSPSNDIKLKIETLVDKKAFENLDSVIYELYDLTKLEIKYIEDNTVQ